jgi:hypothetical protein
LLSLLLSRLMMCGMEVAMDPRNSAAMLISDAIPDQICYVPCSESFDNAFTPAIRTRKWLSSSRSAICGMEVSIDPRNLAAMHVSDTILDQICYMPCSESSDSASAPVIRNMVLLSLSRLTI